MFTTFSLLENKLTAIFYDEIVVGLSEVEMTLAMSDLISYEIPM